MFPAAEKEVQLEKSLITHLKGEDRQARFWQIDLNCEQHKGQGSFEGKLKYLSSLNSKKFNKNVDRQTNKKNHTNI